MSKVAVSVQNVHKMFKLPHERQMSVKSMFINIFRGKRSYEKQHVLKGISFEIKEGEFFGIVGRNGGGKSTLLKLLAGIYTPNQGSVHINGRLTPFIELGVGFNPELTGRENVFLNGALLGFSRSEMEQMYDDIVAFAELERFMDQKLKNYSSGMQVRLAFSIAIQAKSDILLLDEVLAVGDAEFQRKCFEYFRTLKKNKKTVILVSHNMGAVREYCDKALLIEEGRIVCEGNPMVVSEEYLKVIGKDNDTEHAVKRATEKRWGSGEVSFTDITVTPTEDVLTLRCRYEAVKDVESFVVGFSVTASDGQEILGTNTEIEKAKSMSIKAGESRQITWQIPNIFKDGNYTIGVAAHGPSDLPVYDWYDEAASFRIRNDRHVSYPVAPKISYKIS